MINVTFSPNGLVVEKRDHTSIGIGKLDMPSVQEYEKIGRRFKINGHCYYFFTELKSKNKYFNCVNKNGMKCPGSIIITPDHKIAQ
jgi:hypothetical protein